MTESTLPRQTGEEHESTRPCSNCGRTLAVSSRESGSQVAENCESCWPSTPIERAAEEAPFVPVLTGLTDLSGEGHDDALGGE